MSSVIRPGDLATYHGVGRTGDVAVRIISVEHDDHRPEPPTYGRYRTGDLVVAEVTALSNPVWPRGAVLIRNPLYLDLRVRARKG